MEREYCAPELLCEELATPLVLAKFHIPRGYDIVVDISRPLYDYLQHLYVIMIHLLTSTRPFNDKRIASRVLNYYICR